MNRLILIVVLIFINGCSSNYGLQKSTLTVSDQVDVIKAEVGNPYPECDNKKPSKRVANLSVERSERVYLQGGSLCQRSE